MLYRRSILVELSQNFGVDHAILKRSIELYHKNEQAFMNVASASRPHYFRLFQSIGNMTGGVERICSMRADLLVCTVITLFNTKILLNLISLYR
uniref:Bm9293 n=1 Tax=Brugia malayi TaxID=6279 RepID=A0A1I9GDD1_BRUMA|nr:Bm9293 [Brugia malayi]